MPEQTPFVDNVVDPFALTDVKYNPIPPEDFEIKAQSVRVLNLPGIESELIQRKT